MPFETVHDDPTASPRATDRGRSSAALHLHDAGFEVVLACRAVLGRKC